MADSSPVGRLDPSLTAFSLALVAFAILGQVPDTPAAPRAAGIGDRRLPRCAAPGSGAVGLPVGDQGVVERPVWRSRVATNGLGWRTRKPMPTCWQAFVAGGERAEAGGVE
jgi:hypothetical protein